MPDLEHALLVVVMLALGLRDPRQRTSRRWLGVLAIGGVVVLVLLTGPTVLGDLVGLMIAAGLSGAISVTKTRRAMLFLAIWLLVAPETPELPHNWSLIATGILLCFGLPGSLPPGSAAPPGMTPLTGGRDQTKLRRRPVKRPAARPLPPPPTPQVR